ncbi:MAG: hypothetical protein F4Y78_07015 [Candidatus Dadabacteria bacterium]|nr:hypothetical protein [Candidatus Dadabacteria bacterium]MYA48152.1 hypothetical protein [Candidatus Dadabacteria bacterium]MYG83584.1 hypothetical protein [Candidatus Dadabacteria bacterium]MYK49664.1 hypothetical protein [Candidatus Dadabacteria bacterium]
MSRTRGINYPFISLKKALERVQQLYDKEGKHQSAQHIAAEHWDYSERSSGVRQTIAALRAFGLIDKSDKHNPGGIQLSELALRIILDKREDSTEREQAIKASAIKPKIFREMWGKWGSDGLPSDNNMAHFLIFDKKSNEKAASNIVRIFKETITFAGLVNSDFITEDEKDETEETETEISEGASGVVDIKPEPSTFSTLSSSAEVSVQKVKTRQDSCSLDEGQVIIQFPENLGSESRKYFVEWLDLIKKKVGRTDE